MASAQPADTPPEMDDTTAADGPPPDGPEEVFGGDDPSTPTYDSLIEAQRACYNSLNPQDGHHQRTYRLVEECQGAPYYGQPLLKVGKVFFRYPSGARSWCPASSVTSHRRNASDRSDVYGNKSLVVTAGHRMFSGGRKGQAHSGVAFKPG